MLDESGISVAPPERVCTQKTMMMIWKARTTRMMRTRTIAAAAVKVRTMNAGNAAKAAKAANILPNSANAQPPCPKPSSPHCRSSQPYSTLPQRNNADVATTPPAPPKHLKHPSPCPKTFSTAPIVNPHSSTAPAPECNDTDVSTAPHAPPENSKHPASSPKSLHPPPVVNSHGEGEM